MARFGVAVTTLNRRPTFLASLAALQRYSPAGTPIVVVDDGSDVPVLPVPGVTIIRNPVPFGVARAKNQCIAALMDVGVDNLFLFDDDCLPTATGWETPYIESGEHHLSLQLRWTQRCRTCGRNTPWNYNTIKGQPSCDVCQPAPNLYADDTIHAVEWGSGAMLYFTRHAIDTVGGLRTEFGRYGGEHLEIGFRCRNAGLTRHPFQDVLHPTLKALDATSSGGRSCIPERERRDHHTRGIELLEQFKNGDDFVPFWLPPVTVCIPRRDTPDRVDAHNRCHQFWTDHGFTVISADSDPDQPYLCAQSRNNAIADAGTDIVVVADADTIVDDITQISDAVAVVAAGRADMVFPYTTFKHIDKLWALKPDYKAAPVQQSYENSPGGIFVMSTAFWRTLGGFDERFARGALGYDDNAMRLAAETMGTVRRIPGIAWSFNHQTNAAGKPDRDFSEANPNLNRWKLYLLAAKAGLMEELLKK